MIVRFVLGVLPPFSAGGGGVLVGADDGGVDLDQPVDVVGRVSLGLDLLQSPGEDAGEGVPAQAGVDRFPRPVAFLEQIRTAPRAVNPGSLDVVVEQDQHR